MQGVGFVKGFTFLQAGQEVLRHGVVFGYVIETVI